MSGTVAAHFEDDSLEAYSLGCLACPETAPLEEHLLVCTECRDRLTGWDDYARAMVSASRGLRLRLSRGLMENRGKDKEHPHHRNTRAGR